MSRQKNKTRQAAILSSEQYEGGEWFQAADVLEVLDMQRNGSQAALQRIVDKGFLEVRKVERSTFYRRREGQVNIQRQAWRNISNAEIGIMRLRDGSPA